MNELADGRPIGFDHIRAVLRVASADGPPAADVPGQRVQRNGDRLVLTGRAAGTSGRSPVAANLFRYALSIPGEVQVAEIGCAVSAQWQSRAADLDRRAMAGNGPVAAVRFDGQADRSLIVRNRRPGDRFRPFGLRGEKKLQDFFVDLKIPRIERDTVPVVVDEQNRIVWVGGHRIDEAFRVTEPADHVLLLRITRV
jgi:tRNA(Ile)-lysidine synthase